MKVYAPVIVLACSVIDCFRKSPDKADDQIANASAAKEVVEFEFEFFVQEETETVCVEKDSKS